MKIIKKRSYFKVTSRELKEALEKVGFKQNMGNEDWYSFGSNSIHVNQLNQIIINLNVEY